MKKIIFCFLIVLNNINVFSQIDNVNDYFFFANLGHKKRIEYLKEKNWKQTGYTIHETFGSWYNEELTFVNNDTNYDGRELTLCYNVERNDTTLTVKISLNDDLYKIWVKKLKSIGYDFQKDEELDWRDIYKGGIENDPNLLKDSYIQLEVFCAEDQCENYISIIENPSLEENKTVEKKANPIESNGSGKGSESSEGIGVGSGGTMNGIRVRLNDPNTEGIKSDISCKISLKLTIDEDGNVISAENIVSKTTTDNIELIKQIIENVKSQVKYSKKKGSTNEKVFLTINIGAK